jgi:hypothetical protein
MEPPILLPITYISLAPSLVFVGFATRPDPPMPWDGVELHTGDLEFHSRGEQFHQRTTGPCSWSLLGLPRRMSGYEAMIEEVRFAEDSPLEGDGFEP